MDVSVIIVNYNTRELTKNTIDSVFEKTKDIKVEIILVDNASSDGSQEFFDRYYGNKIKFIKSEENLGFGKGNNLGIKEAKGEYVFFLNSDTLLINNAIKILKEHMDKSPKAGICGGNLYNENMEPCHSYDSRLPGLFHDFYGFFRNFYAKFFNRRLDFNYSLKVREVGYITGADMFVRKKILDKEGGFDPIFFMYYEETELTHRIKKMGCSVISVPQAKIIHLEGKSFSFKESRFRMMMESKYRYFNKVYGKNMVRVSYYSSQLKYIILPNKENREKIKINREEYLKFIDTQVKI